MQLSGPLTFSGLGQRASSQLSANLVLQSKSARLKPEIAGGLVGSAEVPGREPRRKVPSRVELQKNGFNNIKRAHDILSSGVLKN